MMHSVFSKTLYDLRWNILAFCIGLGMLAFFTLFIYPSVADAQEGMFDGLAGEAANAILGSANPGTPEGFLNVQLFSFLPLFLAIFLIIASSATVAGEEGDKTLGVLMARPVSRWRVLTEKAAAISVGLILITLAIALGAVLGAVVAGVDINLAEMAAAIVAAIPWGLFVLGFGLFCSAIFKSRMWAALLATGVVVAAYMFNSLTEFVSSLVTYNRFLPMYYYNWGDPLIGQLNWIHVAVLSGAGLIFYLLALLAFERREIIG
jgi:ABC-2 type transport system permease protein